MVECLLSKCKALNLKIQAPPKIKKNRYISVRLHINFQGIEAKEFHEEKILSFGLHMKSF
jgi:hypothetical protein